VRPWVQTPVQTKTKTKNNNPSEESQGRKRPLGDICFCTQTRAGQLRAVIWWFWFWELHLVFPFHALFIQFSTWSFIQQLFFWLDIMLGATNTMTNRKSRVSDLLELSVSIYRNSSAISLSIIANLIQPGWETTAVPEFLTSLLQKNFG
jgi:hypothetical protein